MEKSVCFIGHRKIKDTPELREKLWNILARTYENGTVNFIFGDHSEFNSLCYELTERLKKLHPEIQRIHFRPYYENADEYTMQLLLSGYDQSICPKGIDKAGTATYVERNRAMIRESSLCIFYLDDSYQSPIRHRKYLLDYQPNSGTRIAYKYAIQQKKNIINLFE